MPANRLPSPWAELFRDLDASVTAHVELHCFGGFVLTAVYGVARSTADVDYIAIVPNNYQNEIQSLAGEDSTLAKRHRVYLQYVGIPDVPEDYEERLTEFKVGLKNVALKIFDPYDLCLSKLTRNSPKDREDVKALANKQQLKFSTLMDRYSREMEPWLPNLERHELTLKLWREYFVE